MKESQIVFVRNDTIKYETTSCQNVKFAKQDLKLTVNVISCCAVFDMKILKC